MLDTFRTASRSWPIKVLFALLILSFIAWGGFTDVLRSTANRPAIVVGHQDFSAAEVNEEFRRDFEQVQRMFGGKLTIDQARQMGLMQRTVQQMISRSLADQATDDLKLTVDDGTLRRLITEAPAFQNELKVFDKTLYQRALQRIGMSERQFLALSRGDILRGDLTRTVAGGIIAPSPAADVLFRYRQEKRVAEVINFPADKVPAPAKPSDAALQDYYKGHQADFMAPELRALNIVMIRTADVSGDIKPSDADIEKSYQIRQGEFSTAEKRKLEQVTFPDQDKAAAFAAKAQGKDFAAAAKAEGKDVVDLGWQDRAGLPLPQLGDAAFALKTAGVTSPVQSPLGWHVIHVASIAAGQTRPLSDVRSIIVADLVKEEATQRLYAQSTKLEDQVGSGAGIDEIAGNLSLKPIKIAAVDAQGLGEDGKPVAAMPTSPTLRAAAFQVAQGSMSEVVQLENNAGYFVLRVDNVTPPAVRPFDKVKSQVEAAWTADQKADAARKLAEAAAERLKKGDAIAAVAGQAKVETTQPFLRVEPEGSTIAPALSAAMFKGQPGDVQVIPTAQGSAVARLKQVIPADAKAASGLYDRTRAQLSQALATDLQQQFMMALEKEKGVTVNTAVIERQAEK